MDILIAGDYCPRKRVATLLEKKEFETVLGDVKRIATTTDYSIINLECPVLEHDARPIEKCGPNLHCNSQGIKALKWAGFDCVTLANNHFYDFGSEGVHDTIDTCNSQAIDYVGGGVNIDDASKTLYKDKAGFKFAIINCCEHEFSIANRNKAGSNPLNIVRQYNSIQEARQIADHVIVIVHGGIELFWLPSSRMIETYRFFIDAGADAVVNHHQHCFSGYEIYKEKPIFYGLGNFCFDGIGSGERWTSGFMVKLHLEKEKCITYELIPYRQCDEQVGVHLLEGKEKAFFFKQVEYLNDIISDDSRRENSYIKWCDENKDMYKSALNPLYNGLTKKIFDGPIGKKLISKAKWLHTKNYIVNESHIERVRLLIDDYLNISK